MQVFLSLDTNLTSLLLILKKVAFQVQLPMKCLSSVSSEKGEATQLQENSVPI